MCFLLKVFALSVKYEPDEFSLQWELGVLTRLLLVGQSLASSRVGLLPRAHCSLGGQPFMAPPLPTPSSSENREGMKMLCI